MTNVAILPIPTGQGGVRFQAVGGKRRSEGRTAGEALDALTAQLPEDAVGTLVVVQYRQPDAFFNASQQARLEELMVKWRAATDSGAALPTEEQEELDQLIETELIASGRRAAAIADACAR